MGEKRAAALVAGLILVVAGVYVQTLPAGDLFGYVSVIGGGLLLIATMAVVVHELRTGKKRPQSPRDAASAAGEWEQVRAVPGVTFRDWVQDTPWGTTPPGIASSAIVPAALTLLFAIAPRTGFTPASQPAFSPVLVLIGELAVAFVLMRVLPWLFERWTRPTYLLGRRVEARVLIPTAVVTGVAALLVVGGQPRWWAMALVIAQIMWAGGVALAIHRRTRHSELAPRAPVE